MRLRAGLLIACLAVGGAAASAEPLRVCADPNNLPFSDQAGQGFENKIATVLAHDLRRPVVWVWWAQRRGYVRNTLALERCDVWPGAAVGQQGIATSQPYYRSSYVFVTRADAPLARLSLDDVRLRTDSIGVQMIGNDATNTPPAHAIASRGIRDHVHGYMLYGNYARPHPASRIIEAVAQREIDIALAWGPLAGYFAARSPVALRIEPIEESGDLPMSFAIALGVRPNDPALLEAVNAALTHHRHEIATILAAYHVPLAP